MAAVKMCGGDVMNGDVDYHCHTLNKLEEDLAARVLWGSSQQPTFAEFDTCSSGERKLVDDVSLALAFSLSEKNLMVYGDFVDKPRDFICNSTVTEGAMNNVWTENTSTSNHVAVGEVIDWNVLEIDPIAEEQAGAVIPIIDEDALYAFVSLRAEDERAKKAKWTYNLQDAEILVDDRIPGEDIVRYDMEDPPMAVGSRYASMNEFRAAVRQHAIKGQFEFRGYCRADGCPWSIVARLMADGKQVRVTLNKEKKFCSSTSRVKTTMASYHRVAEKAIPFLKKDQNMGATKISKLQKELEDKYQVTIGRMQMLMEGSPRTTEANNSPGPLTRSNMQTMERAIATDEGNTSPGPVTRSQMQMLEVSTAGTSDCSTPRKQYYKIVKKKITPRKSKKLQKPSGVQSRLGACPQGHLRVGGSHEKGQGQSRNFTSAGKVGL
ncbi:LOW QUALITY PROTEIN: hypothetical protein U9M48_037225 [Paspalum notatum var. saurae]|uniref:Transposase MuDR plant domain-containing protein n=1 Tax=Paspalum notatum var. saurae TaxID=547442 RepID=A0AAQ3X9Q7_PASNO